MTVGGAIKGGAAVGPAGALGGFLGTHADKTPAEWAAIIGLVLLSVAVSSWARLVMIDDGKISVDTMGRHRRVTVGAFGLLAMTAFVIVLSTGATIVPTLLIGLTTGTAGPYVVARWLKRTGVFGNDDEQGA